MTLCVASVEVVIAGAGLTGSERRQDIAVSEAETGRFGTVTTLGTELIAVLLLSACRAKASGAKKCLVLVLAWLRMYDGSFCG